MTTFAEILGDVYDITKRPDLVAETKLAVKLATQKAHHSDFYPRDLREVGFSWNVPAYIQSLEYQRVFPQFRALKYLRKVNSGTPGEFFEVITPAEVLDSYSRTRTNVCYLAGRMIEIRSSTQDTDALIGFYEHPVTTEDGYSSWIADQYKEVIVVETSSIIFKMIGFDEQASMMNKLTDQNIGMLRASALQLEGF